MTNWKITWMGYDETPSIEEVGEPVDDHEVFATFGEAKAYALEVAIQGRDRVAEVVRTLRELRKADCL